jgi:hypothetical protein
VEQERSPPALGPRRFLEGRNRRNEDERWSPASEEGHEETGLLLVIAGRILVMSTPCTNATKHLVNTEMCRES